MRNLVHVTLGGSRGCGPWGPSQVCQTDTSYENVHKLVCTNGEAASLIWKEWYFVNNVHIWSRNRVSLLHISGYEIACLFVLLRNCSLLLFASYNPISPLGGKNCNQLMQGEALEVTQEVSHTIDWDILPFSLQLCLPRCAVHVINHRALSK